MPEPIGTLELMQREFGKVMDGGKDANEDRLLKIMELQRGLLSGKGRRLSYLVELGKLRDMGDV